MVSYHPSIFGEHRHCSSREIMFLVVEGQGFTCLHLIPPLLFISEAHTQFQNLDRMTCQCLQ